MPVSLSLRLCGENAVNRFADSLRKRGKALPSGAKTRPCGRAFLCAVHPWFRSDTRNYRQWQENVAHSVCASVVASRLRM